ncbi:MAG: penicillin-binding protein 1C [Nannocystaceae bacterium]|nr:penicillin-binding protein 1C [Myxococcales bacterium]
MSEETPIKRRRGSRRARWLTRAGLGLGLALGVGYGLWGLYRASAGEPTASLEDRWHLGARVLDRDGALLRELPSEEGFRGRAVTIDDIGGRLVQATLTSEDSEFYRHDGVDPLAIARAMEQNVRHRKLISGASTVTQQLVKLLDGHARPASRGLADKLREMARAQNLEVVLDKEAILVAYMNRLPYGHGMMGPEAAARGYFGVGPADLSWAQAAALAVLPRAPSFLDPYDHLERVRLRQQALLRSLHAEGHLDAAALARALAEPLVLRPLERPFLAPHFVESLRKEGAIKPGEVTRTTLDHALQDDVEGLTRLHLAELSASGAHDAAVLVVDNDTGEVLTYVGSADFHDPAIAGQVDMIRALRQPGSTLKPFVFAAAFARGRSSSDVLPDVPTRFVERHGATYTPANFNRVFEGPISAREALAGSLNVPAVRLAAELDDGALLELLHQLGFASLDQEASHYGLALALGSGEVRLAELARAYVTLARGGERIPLRMVFRSGQKPGAAPEEALRVFTPEVAAQVSEVLSDPLARIRGLHGRGPFSLPYPAAVKTGTSSGYRDTWAVGYTRERTVAVWVGNADGKATAELTGASGAGQLFTEVMRRAMQDVEGRRPLWDPELLASAEVCPLSGKLAGPDCDEHVTRMFAHDHQPTESCDLHRRVTPVRTRSATVYRCDDDGRTRAAVFPAEYEEWLMSHAPEGDGPDLHGTLWLSRGLARDCEPRSQELATLKIESPALGSVFNLGARGGLDDQVVELRAALEGGAPPGPDGACVLSKETCVSEVEFVLDGEVVARSRWPFRAKVSIGPGDHEALARPVDRALAVRLAGAHFSVR